MGKRYVKGVQSPISIIHPYKGLIVSRIIYALEMD